MVDIINRHEYVLMPLFCTLTDLTLHRKLGVRCDELIETEKVDDIGPVC